MQNKTTRFFRITQLIGIIGVSLLVLNFIYQLWHLHTKHEATNSIASCDLQIGGCSKQLPGNQTIRLSMTPLPMRIGEHAIVAVTLTGSSPDRVDFLLYPYPATKPSDQPSVLMRQQEGIYTGRALIKKTANVPQKWVALVILQEGTQRIEVPFQFEVH